MDTKRYTPELIVKEDLLFSIPLYQRLFAWGENQVLGLLDDLYEHFSRTTVSSPSPYYLGMLSCIYNGGQYDLIDGQQRISVILLLGIVMREYLADDWNSFLKGGKRVKFIARSRDTEYLSAKIQESSSIPTSNAKMEEAINVITRFMADDNKFNDNEDRRLFAERIYKHLSFYFSILPSEYYDEPMSLNKYFEAMNAHGKSLEQHEILKVELMRDNPNKEFLTKIWNSVAEMDRPVIKRNIDIDDINTYRQRYLKAIDYCKSGEYSRAYDYCISSNDRDEECQICDIRPEQPKKSMDPGKKEDARNRSIISFQEFLLLVLDINLNLNGEYGFYRKELLTTFKEKRDILNIERFYYDLLHYRLLLDYYVITKENDNIGNKYELLYNEGSHSDEFKKSKDCVIQYQSMLYISQTPIYKWLKPLLIYVRNYEINGYCEILSKLKECDYRELPDEKNLSYKGNVDRYWFWRLDYYLWENQEEYFTEESQREIVNDYIFRANRSIEHLHPKNQEHNTEWNSEQIHTFGNLAMISQGFNSQQSDDPVTVKFARILDQANNHNLQSIKLYKMYLDAKRTPEGWTTDVMNHHQAEMYELLKRHFNKTV